MLAADPGVTSLDIVTLSVAIFGAVTGAVALAVQIVAHVVSGVRARIEFEAAVQVGSQGLVRLGPKSSGFALGLPRPREPGFAVTVVNRGRLPTNVNSIEIAADQIWLRPFAGVIGPSLPHRLDVAAEETWFIHASAVQVAIAATPNQAVSLLAGRVSLGNGSVITAPPIDAGRAMEQIKRVMESD